jgi:succinoglycan biosynthesis transport protein ExoP
MEKEIQVFGPASQAQMPAPPLDYFHYEESQSSPLRDYLQILLKRKWWSLGFLAFAVVIALLINSFSTPIYQSSATFKITLDNSAYVGSRDSAMPFFRDDDRTFETQAQVMRSRTLARRVIKLLDLQNHPLFTTEKKEGAKDIPPEEAESAMVDKFLANLKVEPVKRSDLVRVSYLSPDKSLAQRVPNVFAEEYMQFEIDSKNQSFAQIRRWLGQQLTQLGNRVEGSQQKLYQYGENGEILSPEEKDNVVVQKYIELNGLLTKASAERMAKEAQYRQIEAKGVAASPITNNGLVMELRKQISTETAKVASLRKIYLPNHPTFMAEAANLEGLKARLNNEIQNIRATVRADYEAARRSENLVAEAVESEKNKVGNLQKKLVQYKILKRDVEANEELYKGLLSRMKEAAIASTMVASNLSTIDPAEKPLSPYSPKKARNMALAIILGLLGGTCLAFTIEYFDDSIKTTGEAETLCHLPVLGIYPLLRRNKGLALLSQDAGARDPGHGLIPYDNPKSMVADAIFGIRTSILLSGPAGPPATIMVTSPNPSEGKSTISANLAISLAIDGRKVLLIDCDMRHPSIHKMFNLLPMPGLSDALTGSASLHDIIRPSPISNLSIITAGTTPPNPVSLLGSQVFKDSMESLRDEFQHIIIDTPPTLGMPDSRILSPFIEAVILVLKYNSTTRGEGRAARLSLSQVHAKMIGLVLNQVSSHRDGYSSYYKYYKYYDHEDSGPSGKSYLSGWGNRILDFKNSWWRKPQA